MMKQLILTAFLSFFIAPLLLAQDPCKNYPMNGYTGKCSITTQMSSDGKFVYTSDLFTLKKWDIVTKKVVDEINPFPYMLTGNSTKSEQVIVLEKGEIGGNQSIAYDLQKKALVDTKAEALALLSIEGKKSYDKLIKKTFRADILLDRENIFLIVTSNDVVSKLDPSSGKVITIGTAKNQHYEPISKTLFLNVDGKLELVNTVTLSRIKTGRAFDLFIDQVLISPDKKYLITISRDVFVFLDPATGNEVKTLELKSASYGSMRFKSDNSGFYIYGTQSSCYRCLDIKRAQEYSYPDFTMVKDHLEIMKNYKKLQSVFLDPDKNIFHLQKDDYHIYQYDVATAKLLDSLSFRYKMNADEAENLTAEKEGRIKTGNKAISALYNMKMPAMYHEAKYNITINMDDYSDDGLVLMRDAYHSGAAVILWSFPKGEPLIQYYNTYTDKKTGIGSNSVVVPERIHKSYLSTDAKQIAFNTYEGLSIYESSTLKVKLDKKYMVALFNGKALITNAEYNALELISTETGKTIHKVAERNINNDFVDRHHAKDKVYFVNQYGVAVYDLAKPAELTSVSSAEAEKIGYLKYSSGGGYSMFRKNRTTGKDEPIPGYRKPDKAYQQNRYLLTAEPNEGFQIFDVETGKTITPKPLYSGWTGQETLVYFKNLNKLLVVENLPVFCRPNADVSEPGASAYTIDIASGEITPYLLHESRQEYVKMVQAFEAAMYAYTPKTDCERKTDAYPPGAMIPSRSAFLPTLLSVGYDCTEKVYIVATRDMDKVNGIPIHVVRLHKKSLAELESDYIQPHGANRYEICAHCGGAAAGMGTFYYTGWTDWEQQNFNIYTRRKVTNQKTVERAICGQCQGQGWIQVK